MISKKAPSPVRAPKARPQHTARPAGRPTSRVARTASDSPTRSSRAGEGRDRKNSLSRYPTTAGRGSSEDRPLRTRRTDSRPDSRPSARSSSRSTQSPRRTGEGFSQRESREDMPRRRSGPTSPLRSGSRTRSRDDVVRERPARPTTHKPRSPRSDSSDRPERSSTRPPREGFAVTRRPPRVEGEKRPWQDRPNRQERPQVFSAAHSGSRLSTPRPATRRNESGTPFRVPVHRAPKPTRQDIEEGIAPMASKGERIQKALAQLGWGARREIEDWIRAGDVWINGQPAELGAVLVSGDKVEIIRGQKGLIEDGKRPRRKEVERYLTWHPQSDRLPRVLLYHKPEGEIISRDDPQNRPSSFTNLPRLKGGRWINIGRLDIASSGLIMFTDDGELANRLMHPSANLEREYAVRINGTLSEEHIRQLLAGVELEDGVAICLSVMPMSDKNEGRNQWYKLILTEGKNREIRRMVEALGYQVSRLMRVRYGPVFMPRGLRRGKHEELDRGSVEKMLRMLTR